MICLVLGNLAGVREWIAAADPPGDYDWFEPSRVIPGTINEFPWFSFLLGDLHAHVLALPFTFVALAFALQVALAGPRGNAVWRGVAEALRPGWQSAPCTRSTRGRIRWPPGCWCSRWRSGSRSQASAGSRVRRQLAGAGAGRERRADAAVLARVRPGSARGRPGRRAAAVHRLRRRPRAPVRHLRVAAGGRLRWPACWPRGGRCDAGLGRGGGDLRAARCWRSPTWRGRRARRAARGRGRRRCSRARWRRPSGSCGC